MQQLRFKPYTFRFKNSENKVSIFDIIRKKFVVLTPEEWVRQHVILYLHQEKNYPISLINVEKNLKINGLNKRYDIVVFHSSGKINILVECKSSKIEISQNTFDQIARYNLTINADFLMVTNGLNHFYCRIQNDKMGYEFLKDLPDYQNISKE